MSTPHFRYGHGLPVRAAPIIPAPPPPPPVTGLVVDPSTYYAAILAAKPGDLIQLKDGNYGRVSFSNVVKSGPVFIQGLSTGAVFNSISFNGCTNLQWSYINTLGFDASNQYCLFGFGCDGVGFDHVSMDGGGALDADGVYFGSLNFWRECNNFTFTNSTLTRAGDQLDSLNCSNVVIGGNHFSEWSGNASFHSGVTTGHFFREHFGFCSKASPGSHTDCLQFAASYDIHRRCTDLLIEDCLYDAGNRLDAFDSQGPCFLESCDRVTVRRVASFGANFNTQSYSDCTAVDVRDCWGQSWPSATQSYGSRILVRGGSNGAFFANVEMTQVPAAYNGHPLYPGDTELNSINVVVDPSCVVIPNATGPTDRARLNAWLARPGHENVPAT